MLLIFDCDGVVLDSMGLHAEVEVEAYAALGITIEAAELVRRFSGISQGEVSRALSKETGVFVPHDFDTLVERKKEATFTIRLQPIPGIKDVLQALDHIPRCIASGTGVSGLKHMLGITDLYDFFAPHIYSSEMVSKGKPAPDIFLYAAENMGYSPQDCLVIEDGISGVIAGKAAGMRVLGFIGGSHCDLEHADRLRQAGADLIFDNMRDLPDLIKGRI